MNYLLLSLIENAPDGFLYRATVEQRDVRRWPFALLAATREDADAVLEQFGNTLVGIILTYGTEQSWHQCAPLLFHFTVPHELRANLAPLIHSHLVLLGNCQQAENRYAEQALNLLRASEASQRQKLEFTAVKDSLLDELSERRRVEEELLQQKNLLSTILESTTEAIFAKDIAGEYISINEAGARMLGCSAADVIGHTDSELISAEMASEFRKTDKEIMSTGQVCIREEIGTIGGKPRVFLAHKAPWRDNAGSIIGVIGVSNDITMRKQAEEEKLELERHFQHTQRLESLGVMAGGIAHDFNNILAVIIGHCGLLKLIPDSADYHIQQMEKAAERAAGLCRQMLAYAGKTESVLTLVNMAELVGEMVRMLKTTIHQNATIKTDLSVDIPSILADAGQIRQIVMNLIINAAEAIGETQGEIHVSLVKTLTGAGQTEKDHLGHILPTGWHVCLEVSDTGCGMEDETRQRVFEPFYTTKFTGRGLGMSAVLGIINAHNGALQLSSQPGRGTTFKVYLPAQINKS